MTYANPPAAPPGASDSTTDSALQELPRTGDAAEQAVPLVQRKSEDRKTYRGAL
jgi:hypothetical protein